ncbi:MAG: hypothetical protein DRQ60_05530 [Gammaproteobacteria bacterium]|nr:MAG: hypothetical protein DRQ54_04875 [Gammaproteobacteria bacterium]RLA14031.1 MAG: hypothetical protein DRQ52_05055 [Gammaproteobacteria bacterium]RLA15770.1 MAG: hypothetical protein DRQ60_05530 [Gammaproteobacteria bacterium]
MKQVPTRLTTGQIAKLSSVHINVVKKWIADGLLNAYRLPAGHFRIEKKEYLRFLNETGMPLPDELRDLDMPRILIIDDDQDQLDLVETFLDPLQFSVETATDGHLGLIQIGAFKPDLVLLDINMPRANGFDVLEALKKQQSNPEIIIVTGERSSTLTSQLAIYSIRDILYKPFSLTDLKEAVAFLQPEIS